MSRSLVTRLPMYVVDAFSSRPFSGNPAAVCLLAPGVHLQDELRQRVAAEMNHSETAFIEPLDASAAPAAGEAGVEGGSGLELFSTGRDFRLRWFTPTCEVPCCGHATLASAAVLMQACRNPQPSISFHTLSGELVVSRCAPPPTPTPAPATPTDTSAAASAIPQPSPSASTAPHSGTAAPTSPHHQHPLPPQQPQPAESQPLQLSLSLPLYDPVDPVPACAADPEGPLARACGGGLPVREVRYCGAGGLNYVLMVLGEGVGRRELEGLRPDFEAMARAAPAEEVHGVIVCVRTEQPGDHPQQPGEEPEPEVCSRFFAPWMGINEDPVTGSAHAVLGPYWEAALRPSSGGVGAGGGSGSRGAMRMRQCSARGGDVAVEVLRAEGRVRVSGSATLVLEGVLRL